MTRGLWVADTGREVTTDADADPASRVEKLHVTLSETTAILVSHIENLWTLGVRLKSYLCCTGCQKAALIT